MNNGNELFQKKEEAEVIEIKDAKGFLSYFSGVAVLYSIIFFPWALYLLLFPEGSSEANMGLIPLMFGLFVTNIAVVIMLWRNIQHISDKTLKNKTFYSSFLLIVFVGFLFAYSITKSVLVGVFFTFEFFIGLFLLWILKQKNLYVRTAILLIILFGLAYCLWALVHFDTEVYFINQLDY